MTNKIKYFLGGMVMLLPIAANALTYETDSLKLSLSGYGTAGVFEPNFEEPDFIGDFRIRGQLMYKANDTHSFGAAYMFDEIALNEGHVSHDAFVFWQWNNVGRIEMGLTNSVAHKMGLGLPDVGGLRLNEESLIFRKMGTGGVIIANPEITNGSEALRMNIVSVPISNVQYGLSFAGITGDYDFETDMAVKVKLSSGKTKYAFSFGASYMLHPDGFRTDDFSPRVFADWRGQIYSGLNIQYNSWIFGLTGRLIYDENPVGPTSDGIVAGTGVSYDILNYTLSASYLFSETGIWHDNDEKYIDNTVLASFRYKYSEHVDMWTSVGFSRTEPFLSAGIRATF